MIEISSDHTSVPMPDGVDSVLENHHVLFAYVTVLWRGSFLLNYNNLEISDKATAIP